MARRVALAALAFTPGCEGEAPPEDPCALRCEQNAVVRCDEAGEPVRQECGEARCAADSPAPQCVPATALPCDPEDPPADRCENGRVVTCEASAAYVLAVACPTDQLCAKDATACQPASELTCDPRLWTVLCVNGQRFECAGDGRVAVVAASCPE
ncbi:MAG: hypothetical protein H6702_07305 [Myxococcales bacterium]|nr:hypothetical protein [Myxococcales bacterium]